MGVEGEISLPCEKVLSVVSPTDFPTQPRSTSYASSYEAKAERTRTLVLTLRPASVQQGAVKRTDE